MFVGRNSEEKKVVGSCYGSLAYANLERELRSRKQYEEGFMKVTAQSLWKSAVELKLKVPDHIDQDHFGWLFPAPFWTMQVTNYPRYLEGDRVQTKREGIGAKNSNVQVGASRTVSEESARKHELPQVASLENIEVWKELFANYGDEFMFSKKQRYMHFLKKIE